MFKILATDPPMSAHVDTMTEVTRGTDGAYAFVVLLDGESGFYFARRRLHDSVHGDWEWMISYDDAPSDGDWARAVHGATL